MPQPTFEGEGFTRHVLKIRGRQLDTDPSDFFFSITEVTDWWDVDVGFEGVREGFFKLLQLRGPSERTNDVHVDVILSPFGGSDPAQAPNPFLCCRVSTLPVVAEKPGTRGKVDYGTLAFLEQRITGLHVVEGSVEAGINGEVELVAGVVSQGDAGSRSLSIVNQDIQLTKFLFNLVDNVLDDGPVIGLAVNVRLDGEDLNAILLFEFLLCRG